jgi:hypothetical protein
LGDGFGRARATKPRTDAFPRPIHEAAPPFGEHHCSFALAVACGSSTTAGPSGDAAGSDATLDPAQAVTATTPIWKNITLQNVTVTGSTNAGKSFGLAEEQISNVTFDNVQIQAKTGIIVYDASVTGITTHTHP